MNGHLFRAPRPRGLHLRSGPARYEALAPRRSLGHLPRGDDRLPRIKSARALVKREGEALAEEQIASDGDGQKCLCGLPATWIYMPGGGQDYCDNCVPRGCSCWVNEDGIEELGADGRRQPCIEFEEVV